MKLIENKKHEEKTMSSYTHFTLEERKYLQKLLSEGKTIRAAAVSLGRHPSSVSREIKRNRSKAPKKPSDNPYNYHQWRANALAITRRRNCKTHRFIVGTPETDYVIEKLNLFWSPEQIAHRWEIDYPNEKKFSTSSIYRAIKRKELDGITKKRNLRRRGKLVLPRSSNYNTIHPDRIIPEWEGVIVKRERIGDWEGDTIYGGIGKGAVVTMVDRKSRFLCAGLISRRQATETRIAITSMLKGQPVKSISLDNGSEFSEFRQIEKELNVPIYFAEPHKPWQRGTNENTNDLLRFFFPKGFDFHSIQSDDLDFVVDLINNRPRKCLDWRSPAEVFYSSVALT